jgi:hypothetical protein
MDFASREGLIKENISNARPGVPGPEELDDGCEIRKVE